MLNVTRARGVPLGSVLRRTPFFLYTNALLTSISSGTVFMYADDTTVYCISDMVDNAITSLNDVLSEFNNWGLENSLTPHSAKCEATLLQRKLYIGSLNSVVVGKERIE